MEKKNSLNFVFLAFAPHGLGISGGDRIFIELVKAGNLKIVRAQALGVNRRISTTRQINRL